MTKVRHRNVKEEKKCFFFYFRQNEALSKIQMNYFLSMETGNNVNSNGLDSASDIVFVSASTNDQNGTTTDLPIKDDSRLIEATPIQDESAVVETAPNKGDSTAIEEASNTSDSTAIEAPSKKDNSTAIEAASIAKESQTVKESTEADIELEANDIDDRSESASDIVLVSTTTTSEQIISTPHSPNKNCSTAIEASPTVEKPRTIDEDIQDAIAKILNDVDEEIPNETGKRATNHIDDEASSKTDEQNSKISDQEITGDIDELVTVTDDSPKNADTEVSKENILNQIKEEVPNEQTEDIASNSGSVHEPNKHDDAPESKEVVISNSPSREPENEHHSAEASNDNKEDTIDDDCTTEAESQNSSMDDTPFLGFEESTPIAAESNLLKRKEAFELEENESKKRKFSIELCLLDEKEDEEKEEVKNEEGEKDEKDMEDEKIEEEGMLLISKHSSAQMNFQQN